MFIACYLHVDCRVNFSLSIKCINSINPSVLPEIRHIDFAPYKTDWKGWLTMASSASYCVAAIYFLSIITSFLTYFGFTVKSVNNDKGFPFNNVLCNSLSQRDQCILICFGYLNRLQILLEVVMSISAYICQKWIYHIFFCWEFDAKIVIMVKHQVAISSSLSGEAHVLLM